VSRILVRQKEKVGVIRVRKIVQGDGEKKALLALLTSHLPFWKTEYAISTHGEDARTFRFPEGESLEEVNSRMGVSLRRYVLPRLEALRSGQERDEPQIVIVAHGIAIAEVSKGT
jgi:hypothetical protein